MLRGRACLCAALGAAATAAPAFPEEDRVERLPGWSSPLLSRVYSGYVDAGPLAPEEPQNVTQLMEHYMLFEGESSAEGAQPVIMWTNGGPGAPSLFGAFTELGPYYVTQQSLCTDGYRTAGVPTLFANPFRWTRLGHLLVRNLPPPVGFSYCNPAGPAGDGYSCGAWNDTRMAEHSYRFMLQAFSTKLSGLVDGANGPGLFLVGESYAGLYVPMLARLILDRRGESTGAERLAASLRGVAVGDGCTTGLGCLPDRFWGPMYRAEFFHGHGQFSTKTYDAIRRQCSPGELTLGARPGSPVSPACKAALDRMDEEIGFSFAYNLYDECYDFALEQLPRWSDAGSPGAWRRVGPRSPEGNGELLGRLERSCSNASGPEPSWHMDGQPCGGTAVLPVWTAHPEVREALHVSPDAHYFSGDNGVGFTYIGTEPDLVEDTYKRWALENMAESNRTVLRMLIYNGDTDPGLNSFVAERWLADLGLPEREGWRPWTRDGWAGKAGRKVGGYVTSYAGNLEFVTIRGSGHMVPEYKPEAAFTMIKSFLEGKQLPRLAPPAQLRSPERPAELLVA